MAACTGVGALACGGDDVPIGGPHGEATTVLVYPTAGNSAVVASDAATGGGVGDGGVGAGGDGAGGGPTWTMIFDAYMGPAVASPCKTCHNKMDTPLHSYAWLASQGYMARPSPALVDKTQSCLSWYGGNMPPGGADNQAAVTDMNAWAAAGALDN